MVHVVPEKQVLCDCCLKPIEKTVWRVTLIKHIETPDKTLFSRDLKLCSKCFKQVNIYQLCENKLERRTIRYDILVKVNNLEVWR